MILDTSALAAILFDEPDALRYAKLICETDTCLISVANFLELCILLEAQVGPEARGQCDAFLRSAAIVIEPVSVEQGLVARQAFLDFGKGRHPARLNFGDCFAYALAKTTGQPLLFKGGDFSKTDVKTAAKASAKGRHA